MEHFDVRKITKLRNRVHQPLTTRERQIVVVLSAGATNKEIGRRLRLAEGTVKVHLHHIYRKLGIANRTALPKRTSWQKPPIHNLYNAGIFSGIATKRSVGTDTARRQRELACAETMARMSGANSESLRCSS